MKCAIETGTVSSCSPCQRWTGAEMSAGSKPHLRASVESFVVHAPTAQAVKPARVLDHQPAQVRIGQGVLIGRAHVRERLVEEALGVLTLRAPPLPQGQPHHPRRALGKECRGSVKTAQVFRAVDARDRCGRAHQPDDAHPVGEREATRCGVRSRHRTNPQSRSDPVGAGWPAARRRPANRAGADPAAHRTGQCPAGRPR